MEPHIIDAQGKTLGRVASEAAKILLGKNKATFVKNAVVGSKVSVINTSKMKITEKKADQTEFITYSGYPGGQKIKKMSKVIENKGHRELVKNAVYGMIPNTKLRPKIMKLLTIAN